MAEAALECYGIRYARLELLQQGFKQVFRVVSTRGEEFILRLYGFSRSGENAPESRTGSTLRSSEVLRSQLAWLAALGRDTDLFVPSPVPTKDGSLVGHVSTEYLNPRSSLLRWRSRKSDARDLKRDLGNGPVRMARSCVLLHWLPGEIKKGKDLTPEEISRTGSLIACLHRHAEGYEPSEILALPRWDWEWPFGEETPLWRKGVAFYSPDEMEAFRGAAQRIRKDLNRLGKHREVFGVIHRDLKPENLVFNRDRVGAIDFDMCGLGYYLFDLSMVHRILKVHYGDRFEPLWAAFIAGYESERSLPKDYQQYLSTFTVMQSVAAVNRQLEILDTEEAGQAGRPDLLPNVANWLKDLSKRWDTSTMTFPYTLNELSFLGTELATVL